VTTGFSALTVQQIIARDNGRCFKCGQPVQLDGRGISWSLHHRRPRAMGGSSAAWVNLPSNGVILCGTGTTGDHGWAESHRHAARELGYLVPLNGIARPSEVAILRWDGALVRLTDDGGVTPVLEGVS
jgi:hypothetical protein